MSWKWIAPILAAIGFVLVVVLMMRPTMGRATPGDTITEWLALIATILSAIVGALQALKKPDQSPPQQQAQPQKK